MLSALLTTPAEPTDLKVFRVIRQQANFLELTQKTVGKLINERISEKRYQILEQRKRCPDPGDGTWQQLLQSKEHMHGIARAFLHSPKQRSL